MSVADSSHAAPLSVTKDTCADFSRSSYLEWLDTNHTGAFAMGTVAGVNTRRYHSLLTASTHPPDDRQAILSRIEETVLLAGQNFELGSAQYPGTVQPHGFELLEEFRLDPFPKWRYNLNGIRVEKSICLLDKRQSVLICYQATEACRISARLMLAFRDYHSLAHRNSALSLRSHTSGGRCSFQLYSESPTLHVLHSGQSFDPEERWYENNEYLRDLERGLDFREDLFSPGSIVFDLLPNTRAWLLASIESDDESRSLQGASIESILAVETNRRLFATPLTHALDQFRIVRQNGKPSLIAGYPWFTDWSRDILISLPALSAAGFPPSETKEILSMLLDQRFQGLLPNRFKDQRGEVEYNTVDGTLWLFIAAHNYIQQSGDVEFLRNTLYRATLDIINWHNRGTLFNINNDPSDDLLFAGEPGVQLTWMDAKIGDYVVTPRIGKPVEINALWYNALRIAGAWATLLGNSQDANNLNAQANATLSSFKQKFVNEKVGCLYDVINGSHKDASIRPNQLFSISLPFPLLDNERAKSVVSVVRDQLLTPTGLRTLAPGNPAYRGRFEGDMAARDSAYHQGTVWPWLIGPFVSAYLFAFGRDEATLAYCDNVLKSVETQLSACCLGSLSEVYDGDSPQHPGGCPAQLWSIAQLILARSYLSASK